jgi:hypothetical protein
MSNKTIQIIDVETGTQTTQTTQLVNKPNSIFSDEFCAKLCLAATTTIILLPFAICDTYLAGSDDACLDQNSHNLSLTMHSYLLANGIITFVSLGGINLGIFMFDLNQNKEIQCLDKEIQCLGVTVGYIMKLFGIAWLVTGCVLFWAYTNMALCKKSTNDYLFTRLILGIIFHVASANSQSNDK